MKQDNDDNEWNNFKSQIFSQNIMINLIEEDDEDSDY